MYSLLQRLRAAASASNGNTLQQLLKEAATEIERLQRMAYRASASRPINFATVQLAQQRHLADEMTIDMDGPAAQAHEDRAQLLSIIAFLSQETCRSATEETWQPQTVDFEVAAG